VKSLVLVAGPLAMLGTLAAGPPGAMAEPAWRVAGLALWMALWWLTAVIPLEATALLPIVILPLLGVGTLAEVTGAYADPVIFLFLGGFFIAATLERWELHRRFALSTVRLVGTDAPRVVLAFLLATAAVSMWISNTATAVMMLPIAAAVAGRSAGETSSGFQRALMLSIAYGASIGGVGTLIGTPPNAIFAANARELLGVEIGFGSWMLVGVPAAILMLAGCWLVLVRLFRVRGPVAGLAERVEREAAQLPPPGLGERFVTAVFVLTAVAWVLREPKVIGGMRFPGLADLVPISDTGIALVAALLLFIVPLPRARFRTALDWPTARQVPWGVLLLFGGGLALAGAFASSGLTRWIGGRIEALHGAPFAVVVLACGTLFIWLTELTSNTATAALGMPLLASVATGLGLPAVPLMAAGALGASMAFMLPVATPPNAIVFGSGLIDQRDMAKAGFWMNLVSMVVVTGVVLAWWSWAGP
jgi:sodium-dependent dicarboxylate transporter 2/3/5